MFDAEERFDAGPSASPARRARALLREAATLVDRLDAEVLLAHHLGIARGALLLDLDQLVPRPDRYALLLARRMRHEPVAYITGRREFWSLDLAVTPEVLIPRPDSETLLEAAADALRHRPPELILDLGCGSGALLLGALTLFPTAFGLGIDRSPGAVGIARTNAGAHGLAERSAFVVGDWADSIAARFDLLLCNPPYVCDGAPLAPDVARFEPAGALFAGPDGLDAFRRLIPDLPRLLAPGGLAILECGAGQADEVAALVRGAGLSCSWRRDLAGHRRACLIRQPQAS
jgi:release factor glutamine methyltransferase